MKRKLNFEEAAAPGRMKGVHGSGAWTGEPAELNAKDLSPGVKEHRYQRPVPVASDELAARAASRSWNRHLDPRLVLDLASARR